MANPSTPGRMLNQSISRSVRFAQLSPNAQRLFVLIIPHLNSHGKFHGDPNVIKGIVCPLLSDLTPDILPGLLKEINDKTNIKWWKDKDGIYWIHALNFHGEQNLRLDRMGRDCYPAWLGEKAEVPDQSGSSPGIVRQKLREVKGSEVKDLLPSEKGAVEGSGHEGREGDSSTSNGGPAQENTAPGDSPLPATEDPKTHGRKPRLPDLIWDTLCEVFGLKPVTKEEQTRLGKVVSTLKKKEATAEKVRIVFAQMEQKGWDPFTPEGLAKWYDQLSQVKPRSQAAAAPVFVPGMR